MIIDSHIHAENEEKDLVFWKNAKEIFQLDV
jgi:hypothetical protein